MVDGEQRARLSDHQVFQRLARQAELGVHVKALEELRCVVEVGRLQALTPRSPFQLGFAARHLEIELVDHHFGIVLQQRDAILLDGIDVLLAQQRRVHAFERDLAYGLIQLDQGRAMQVIGGDVQPHRAVAVVIEVELGEVQLAAGIDVVVLLAGDDLVAEVLQGYRGRRTRRTD